MPMTVPNDQNSQMLQTFFQALDKKDYAKAESYFAPDAELKMMGMNRSFHGIKEIDGGIRGWYSAFPDLKTELLNVVSNGDFVVAETIVRGTHQGSLDGPTGTLKPTQRKINVPGAEVFRFRNGKIISWHCYLQGDAMMTQLGISQAKSAA